MEYKSVRYQLAVVGGGLAGFCAAIAAARLGTRTCIIQNRPGFGGNSSSEIRVTPHGACAFHAYARETGIISELLIEERAVNHEEIFENGWTNSVWDMVLYNMAQCTPDLTIYVNTDVFNVVMKDERHIAAVEAKIQNAETVLTVEADAFIDCSGDGMVADMAGCEWRLGSEGRDEFNEPHAPEHASKDVMGSSIHFKTKNIGRPSRFKAPEWAMHYEDAGFFYNEGRFPKQEKGGYWWLEIGVPYDTIHQNEDIRHELTRHALGVWDWMKNKDPKMMGLTENYALDWIGQVPGKRESRRIMGQYLMTEHDPQNCTVFSDEIAFGGWFIDLHTPGGLLAKSSEPASSENYTTFSDYAVKSYAGPYGIPLRCLIARDVDNLMMAGRNVSVTHAALGTVRVMNTTAIMGQAAGTAAAIACKRNIPVSETATKAIREIQQQLLKDGCFLPNYRNEDENDMAATATLTASSEALLYGSWPGIRSYHEGLRIWKDQPQYVTEKLETRKGQLIAIGSTSVNKIDVLLNNTSQVVQQVTVQLKRSDNIWDYSVCDGALLAEAVLQVPAGTGWVSWNLLLEQAPAGQYVRLDILPNPAVEWLTGGSIESGNLAMYQIGENKMRRFGNGHTLSFTIEPAQPCYGPRNVISGVARPHRYTNLWKSDPARPLPQWLQLDWEDQREIGEVIITFPGHLLREYHAYDPFYRDPQCPRDYTVDAWVDGGWQAIAEVKDNYQRLARHTLPQKVRTDKLRVTVSATNGDPSAQIYEVRCY